MAGRRLRRGCDLRVCFAVADTWSSGGSWLEDGQHKECDGKIQNGKLPNFEITNFEFQKSERTTGESTETCGCCH
jgi:hypothetical protein